MITMLLMCTFVFEKKVFLGHRSFKIYISFDPLLLINTGMICVKFSGFTLTCFKSIFRTKGHFIFFSENGNKYDKAILVHVYHSEC